eukprot:EG_transcript_21766
MQALTASQVHLAQDPQELFEVCQPPPVDHDGFLERLRFTGFTKQRKDVHQNGDWHRSVHVWIYDTLNGTVLIQKRSPEKDTNPNRWDVSCAGHITAGDESRDTFRYLHFHIGGQRSGN